MRQSSLLKEVKSKRELAIGLIALAIGLLLFYWHINENIFVLHIILYFIVNVISIFAIICLWRCTNKRHSPIVLWISIGTMIIFGLHRILMGLINFSIEKIFNITDISYQIPEAFCITICIELLLLPIIIYSYKNCQLLLGKRKTCQNLVISE